MHRKANVYSAEGTVLRGSRDVLGWTSRQSLERCSVQRTCSYQPIISRKGARSKQEDVRGLRSTPPPMDLHCRRAICGRCTRTFPFPFREFPPVCSDLKKVRNCGLAD